MHQSSPAQSLPKCTAIKPSFWAFHHNNCIDDSGKLRKGLHERGIVDQIEQAPRDVGMYANCCSGIHSGECRVTSVNIKEKKVLVDDQWISFDSRTKIVEVEGLEDDEDAVVCAGRSGWYAPSSPYCIGIRGGS